VEALHVLAQSKDRRGPVGTFVGANAFERAETVVDRVSEDVHLGVVPIDQLPVHPDLFDLVDHASILQTAQGLPRLEMHVTAPGASFSCGARSD
jgi:hypothetical protein